MKKFKQFVSENLNQHLHKNWHDDVQKVKKDLESDKQTIKDNKELKIGDYAIHKYQQSLGTGVITKIHPTSHADLHFTDDLKSSTVDGDENYKKFTFHITDLIPVIGTSA